MKKRPLDFSWSLRSQDVIAQNALTNSKRPECFVKGIYPTHLEKGEGCIVWDTAGNRYFDFICGLGSNLLGYGNIEIAQAIFSRAVQGLSLSLSTPGEVLLAEKLRELIPSMKKIKFLKTGTEACLAAIRVARAKTGRNTILSRDYHGWGDPFISLSPPGIGIPKQDGIDAFRDLSQIDSNTAGVIIEAVSTDASPQRRQFLEALRQKCTQEGALLIFDEVITGFRFPKWSVSTFWGIEPDIICLGKAMGGGMPISAVGGSREVMDAGEYFVSSTFAGETASIWASLKLIDLMHTEKYDINFLWEKGKYFCERFNSFCPEKVKITGYPTRGVFEGDPYSKACFFQEACMAGILVGPSWFYNFSHIPYNDQLLNIFEDIMTRVRTNSIKLLGDMPSTPFAQKVRAS